ncbi:family 43 glycosylhydrolase [Flavobacterium sp. DG1-102-2]|uniref:family 43 glycosylhydrolase n=1 Tax=Flavobacterium sp. DG1-102-2 TaxID=3081663 RepID=UPI00294A4961|nr:family 43 glycosylhydrolase [Flavobacterium sp. DG1-102-2]MDV6169479.1 family 43 glycosylhydrolase [Flavobacterium sp. DG1-102-2]
MKNSYFILLLLAFGQITYAQTQASNSAKGADYFVNPIFPGDHADPSIIRDKDDFYIVHSSFDYYPGLLIWHSKDMVNWEPVNHALHKNVGSVWAPDLVKYNNKYYIYFPVSNTNYVVWADNINGPWSEPIDLKIGSIDPGHVVDEKGNRYLYFSAGDYVPLSKDGLSVTGPAKHVYDGWPIPREWSIECFCMEGPKILKKGNYYYLTVAEGGTAGPATSHMVVSARSKSPFGPWENSPYNPIIKTGNDAEKWWSKGHSTIIDDAAGNWWMVFHGYENNHYNMGRQTLLQPVEWTKDGWFKNPDNIKTEEHMHKPKGKVVAAAYSLSDTFQGGALGNQWQFFKDFDTTRFSLSKDGLKLKAKGKGLGDSDPLSCIPADHSYTAQVEAVIEGNATASLILFYADRIHTGIGANSTDIMAALRSWQFPTEKNTVGRHIYLRLEKRGQLVNMFFSPDGTKWSKIENSAEVSGFHHNVLSGFTSLRIGLSAVGEGSVTFKNFIYTPEK